MRVVRGALGMPLRLATYSLGADASGVEAIGYGFEPAGPQAGDQSSTRPAEGTSDERR